MADGYRGQARAGPRPGRRARASGCPRPRGGEGPSDLGGAVHPAPGPLMKKILLFAKLTIREAVRKKLIWVLGGLTVLVLVLSASGRNRLVEKGMTGASEGEVRATIAFVLIMIMFAYSFVLALSAVFITVPSIAGELETGTALAILTRPVSRGQFL